MKIIISEQQSNFLLHDLLDELFKGYREEYVATGEKLIYVGDKLMMIWQPTKAILSKDIMERYKGNYCQLWKLNWVGKKMQMFLVVKY